MTPNKFAVIGLGHFGYSVAKNLAERGAEVLAIDKDMSRVELIKDDVAYAAGLDATDIKALTTQNITEMDAVMVAIGENIEGLLLTTVLLLELKVKRIIARAVSKQQRLILEKLGVREILSPEDEVGILVAERLLNPNMNAFLPLPDSYHIVEIQVPMRIVKKNIGDIEFDNKYQLELIAIRRKYEEFANGRKTVVEHLIRRPSEDIILDAGDALVVLGMTEDTDRFVEVNA